jgi:choline kinase
VRAVIIAGGEGKRWNDYLGVPKHLVSIEKETLLQRTVRQLNEAGVFEIYIVGPNDYRYRIEGTKLYEPQTFYNDLDSDKMLSSSYLWSTKQRNLILFGDVFFTDPVRVTNSYRS